MRLLTRFATALGFGHWCKRKRPLAQLPVIWADYRIKEEDGMEVVKGNCGHCGQPTALRFRTVPDMEYQPLSKEKSE